MYAEMGLGRQPHLSLQPFAAYLLHVGEKEVYLRLAMCESLL
jgi:hypothetical protein